MTSEDERQTAAALRTRLADVIEMALLGNVPHGRNFSLYRSQADAAADAVYEIIETLIAENTVLREQRGTTTNKDGIACFSRKNSIP